MRVAMFARALVFTPLLSCCSLAVMALSFMEEPLRDLPMRLPPPLTISRVKWKQVTSITTLQLCTIEPIPGGQAVLLWGEIGSGGSPASVEEIGDDAEPNCATFPMGPLFVLPASLTFYQLLIEMDDSPELAGKGSIEFSMTAKTSILTCGSSSITKLTWMADNPINYAGPCIATADEPVAGTFATDCYIDGSSANKDLCFTVNDLAVNVCLNGPIDDVPLDGQLTVHYLAYGDPEVLSLIHANQAMSNLRAIVRLADPANPGQTGPATVYECPGGFCSMLAGIVPVYGTYEVCGEARDIVDGSPLQTATAKIIDLKLFAFLGDSRANVLEFVFANGLDSRMYTASLFDAPPPEGLDVPHLDKISVDCTGVEVGNACFGFFSTDAPGNLYIALSSNPDDFNKIIAATPV